MEISEVQKYIIESYLKVFNREPDSSGLDNYTMRMLDNRLNYEELIVELKNSEEYKIITKNKKENDNLEKTGNSLLSENRINFYPFYARQSGYGILGENIFKTVKNKNYNIIQTLDYNLKSDISLRFFIPSSYIKMSSKVNIGYTMFEASKIPDSWVKNCNLLDRLFVPLKSNVEIFKSCGVNIPIDVVPIGIDETVFNPLKVNNFTFISCGSSNVSSNSYKFLIINDGQLRKNNDLVIKAFLDEFRKEIKENKVYLIMRTHNEYKEKNIIWINHYLEDLELASLIKSCDCMISASSGECGDIPILEGMCMEKPVIVSEDLGHSEYIIDNENGFFIKTEKIVPAFTQPQYKNEPNLIGLKDAMWIEPSYKSLKEKMRFVYENREIASNIGKNAREYILKNRTLDICVEPMIKIFNEIFDNNKFDNETVKLINKHVSNKPLKNITICEFANLNKWNLSEWVNIQKELNQPDYKPPDFVTRKAWEWIQCIYGLEKLGVLTENAIGLGVGAGHEPLIHYFSNKINKVIATDLYDENSNWAKYNAKEGDPLILSDLDKFALFPYKKDRIEVKRMNGCDLKFPDNTFDFVWSCSSIEHFGGAENATVSMKEIERVLKPGGIAAIATEFIVKGDKLLNTPELTLFGIEALYKYIISSHKLKLVQPIDFKIDEYCLKNYIKFPEEISAPHEIKKPHMILKFGTDIFFTSIFLFFRKELPLTMETVTYNEEKTIEELLKQSKEYAQEIIVLDSSTDKTKNIIKKYADIIINKQYSGTSDSIGNKQTIIDKANNEWIIYLDGDEILDNKLLEIIKSGTLFDKNINGKDIDGWWFKRKWFVDGKQFIYKGNDEQLKLLNEDWQLRLFRKGKTRWIDGSHSIPQIENTEKCNDGYILHRVQLERFIKRYETYSNMYPQFEKFNNNMIQAIKEEMKCIKKL